MCANASIPSQNPQADLQAQDRCHRIGQTKPVVVYRLVTANTIDQKILEKASAKRKLEQMVIHKSEWLDLHVLPTPQALQHYITIADILHITASNVLSSEFFFKCGLDDVSPS